MPRLPREWTDCVYATSDGFVRQVRYRAHGAASWTNVDLTAASAVYVYLISLAGTVAHTFEAVGADAALFSLESDGTISFTPAADTFSSTDVDSYILELRVVNTDWPAGRTFPSTKGLRILARGTR